MRSHKKIFLGLFSSLAILFGTGSSVTANAKSLGGDGAVYASFDCQGGYFEDTMESSRFVPLEYGQTVVDAVGFLGCLSMMTQHMFSRAGEMKI